MSEAVSTSTSRITSKGQVTIPVHIRKLLGLSTSDKVAFVVTQGKVEIKPAESVVSRTAGILQSEMTRAIPLSPREEKEAAEEAFAEEAMGRKH